MRKIRILAHVSLDCMIEHGKKDGYGGWTAPYRSPAGLEALMEAQGTSFDLLLGRRTYDDWADFWPKAGNSPMADRLNSATKYVATHRPDSLEWGPAKALSTDILQSIHNIQSEDGPDLNVWGSTALTSMLFEQALVDEVVLITYPVLLGQGKRFFSDKIVPQELTFVSTKATPTGVLINTYRHIGSLTL